MADPVARNADVPVARVGAEGLADAGQERQQLVPPEVQQRSYHRSPARPDAGQAGGAGAAQHAQEERLRLVVPGVSRRDAIDFETLGSIGEELVAGPASRDLDRHVLVARQLSDVALAHLDGDPRPAASSLQKASSASLSPPRRPWFRCATPARVNRQSAPTWWSRRNSATESDPPDTAASTREPGG